MADTPRGPQLMTFRELAQRLVADGVVKSMSHQRISQIRKEDPDGFPPTQQLGRSRVVDYNLARPYFENRTVRPGERTDLKNKPADE